MASTRIPSKIDHILILMDESGSMHDKKAAVIRVFGAQVADLARRSRDGGDYETRLTAYAFNERVECIFSDVDVLRVPSVGDCYRPDFQTDLIGATNKVLDDVANISQQYGDHAFLILIVTDGQHNCGYASTSALRDQIERLRLRLGNLPDNVTIGLLVPHPAAKHEAKKFGFDADNIAIWDATSSAGVAESGVIMTRATDTFKANRAAGVRSTKSLFAVDLSAVDISSRTDLETLDARKYVLVPVPPVHTPEAAEWEARPRNKGKKYGGRIDEFVMHNQSGNYSVGDAYYQLTDGKSEIIGGNKDIIIVDKRTNKAYQGDGVRPLLGLTELSVRVKPEIIGQYDIYIQSTSQNRILVPGTRVLMMRKK